MESRHFFCLALLFFLLTSVAPQGADAMDDNELKRRNDDPHTTLELLQRGIESGKLPDGLVIRFSANLFGISEEAKKEAEENGIDLPESVEERWEVENDKLYRIVVNKENKKEFELKRDQSRPFNTAKLCKLLRDGNALEIQKGKGKGEPAQFVGTPFQFGSREIVVEWKGQHLILLGESCLGAGYAESDAIAFAELYESVAKLARERFEK